MRRFDTQRLAKLLRPKPPADPDLSTHEGREDFRRYVRSRLPEFLEVQQRFHNWHHGAGPTDRAACEAIITRIYRRANRKAPVFVWFDSPLDANLIHLWLQAMSAQPAPLQAPHSELPDLPVLRKLEFPLDLGAPAWDPKLAVVRWIAEELRAASQLPLIFMRVGTVDEAIWSAVRSTMESRRKVIYRDGMLDLIHNFAEGVRALPLQRDLEKLRTYLSNLNPAQYEQLAQGAFIRTSSDHRFFSQGAHTRASVNMLMHWSLYHVLGHTPTDDFADWVDAFKGLEAWIPYDQVCLMMERPIEVSLDDLMRPHSDERAAIKFHSNWSVYCIRGIPVPERIFKGDFTAVDIDDQPNVEMRRIMIDRYGLQRYLTDSGAEEIHRDEFGILYQKETEIDEPIVVVQVRNSTPEPDGTFKSYMLRVPPSIRTAKEAVAWTFGVDANLYSPSIET
jgi:hypothetical protein